MRRRTLFIGGGVAALALALSLVGLKVSHHSTWANGARHGGMHMDGHHMNGGMAHFCSSESGAHFDKFSRHLKSELDLSAAQQAAWGELGTAWQHSETAMRATCEAIENNAGTKGVGGLLARAEVQLDAGLSTVCAVRPAFENFYATLDIEQQDTLERFGHRK
jgi:hypothetical protein